MPEKVYLSEIVGGSLKVATDSCRVINGTYHFQGEINGSEAVGIHIGNILADVRLKGLLGKALTFIIDKGETNITHTENFRRITFSGNVVAEQQWQQITSPSDKLMDSLNQLTKIETFRTDAELKKVVPFQLMESYIQSNLLIYNYAKNNPDARVYPFMIYALACDPYLPKQARDSLFNNIPANKRDGLVLKAAITMHQRIAPQSEMVIEAFKKIRAEFLATDFTMTDYNGKLFTLSSLRGKYVLLNFWASWCVPCCEENPNIIKAYNKYNNKGFAVIGVSLDGQATKGAWLKEIKIERIPWTEVSDLQGYGNAVAQFYSVKSLPANFLISPDGKIIAKNITGEALQQKLASIFDR